MPPADPTHRLLARLRDEIKRLEHRPARREGQVASGLASIEALLPGGFPCGALSELRGGPSSGKTAVALSAMAGLPGGALAAFVDGRGELYPPAAAALGVDLGRLLIVRPPGGEEGLRLALWAAEALLGSGAFAVVAVDVPRGRPFRGAEVALRRLVAAAEQGGRRGSGSRRRAPCCARRRWCGSTCAASTGGSRPGGPSRRGRRVPEASMRPERERLAASGPRLLALHLPGLPLQRLARGREGRGERPVAVVEEGQVIGCDAAAQAAGVRPGDALAEALAACGRLLPVAHAPAADLAALRALAEALLAVAPAVEVVVPDALLLDASAAHLLRGAEPEPERRLLARARALAGDLGFTVRAAVACGRGPALALARHGAAGGSGEAAPIVPPGAEAEALAALPLAALGLGPEVVEKLRAVGVDGVGALARLPPEGLALRFGPAGAAAARLARGDDPTPLVPYLPATLPEEAIELEGPVDGAEPVLFVLKRLADRVAARLGGRGLGASRLTVTLKLDPRGEERLSIPLAHPSAVGARWLLASRERLLALRLPGAVVGVKLAAVEVAVVDEAQLALGDRPEAQAALETVLARLSGRLGDGAVVAAVPVARYRPEAAWRPVPFRGSARQPGALSQPDGSAARPTGAGGARHAAADGGGAGGARTRHVGEAERLEAGAAQRPTRLLAEPRPLVATGEGGRVSALRIGGEVYAVLSFEGPERLRGEWWSAPFDRDYYRARVEGLGDCWIYRDGADGRLHLHGFFD